MIPSSRKDDTSQSQMFSFSQCYLSELLLKSNPQPSPVQPSPAYSKSVSTSTNLWNDKCNKLPYHNL